MARRILTILTILGLILGVGVIAYTIWVSQLRSQEQARPSTARSLLLPDGREVALVQPTPAPVPSPNPAVPAQEALSVGLYPPERISLPSIDTEWPVILGDNENLPQFPAVGWFFGSGFPGRPGNMVLFGHLGGPNGTFMRLHELRPGDEFSVRTMAGNLRYKVRLSYETTPDDVTALAPSDTPIVTLITCSGPWDPLAQSNTHRLIVVADFIP